MKYFEHFRDLRSRKISQRLNYFQAVNVWLKKVDIRSMGIVLQILGGIFVMVLLVVAAIAWRTYRAFNSFAKQLATMAAVGGSPSRITLVEPDDKSWLLEPEVQHSLTQLEELGFEKAGEFQIEEMCGLHVVGFTNPGDRLIAAAYADLSGNTWVDICSESTEGMLITCSNAISGDQVDERPGKKLFIDKGWTIQELYNKTLEESGIGPLRIIEAGDFKCVFEEAYAADMDWRNSRGGAPSWGEFCRTAESSGEEYSLEELEEAYYNTVYTMGVLRLSIECIQAFESQTESTLLGWAEVRNRAFALHEHVPNTHLVQFIVDHIGCLGNSDLSRLEELIDEDRSALENFLEFNKQLPDGVRARKVGEIDHPVQADIFAAAKAPEG